MTTRRGLGLEPVMELSSGACKVVGVELAGDKLRGVRVSEADRTPDHSPLDCVGKGVTPEAHQ
jgi:hypothetical protein